MSIKLKVYSKETYEKLSQGLESWSTIYSIPVCNLEFFENNLGIYSINITERASSLAFDPKIPLTLCTRGTPFQEKVWQALLSIPLVQTSTYKEIAIQISAPKAYRAVANAIGQNPFLFLVPCHRVIRSNGVLGGFFWGTELKQKLLSWEQKKNRK